MRSKPPTSSCATRTTRRPTTAAPESWRRTAARPRARRRRRTRAGASSARAGARRRRVADRHHDWAAKANRKKDSDNLDTADALYLLAQKERKERRAQEAVLDLNNKYTTRSGVRPTCGRSGCHPPHPGAVQDCASLAHNISTISLVRSRCCSLARNQRPTIYTLVSNYSTIFLNHGILHISTSTSA